MFGLNDDQARVVSTTLNPIENLLRFVGAAVIDYDQFKVGVTLCQHDLDGGLYQVRSLIGGQDNAYHRAIVCAEQSVERRFTFLDLNDIETHRCSAAVAGEASAQLRLCQRTTERGRDGIDTFWGYTSAQ